MSVLRTGFAVRRGLMVERNPDLEALSLGDDLRRGVDITVTAGGVRIRMLSIHLKSFCFDDPLDSASDACQKLARQLPILEEWIDAPAAEGIPFIVLGDWNRRFDTPGDGFWPSIDDGRPLNADLTRITRGEEQLCW